MTILQIKAWGCFLKVPLGLSTSASLSFVEDVTLNGLLFWYFSTVNHKILSSSWQHWSVNVTFFFYRHFRSGTCRLELVDVCHDYFGLFLRHVQPLCTLKNTLCHQSHLALGHEKLSGACPALQMTYLSTNTGSWEIIAIKWYRANCGCQQAFREVFEPWHELTK